MTDPIVARIAKQIAALQRRLDGITRTPQLPASSIEGPDGEQAVADAMAQATDAAADLIQVADQLLDTDGLGDESAFQSGTVTPQIEGAAGDQAFSIAVRNATRVRDALAGAEQAAIDAAAATETALGFARYSQVNGGPIVPDLPVDGPRQGAELVHVDLDGHPYQVDVWNGTAWVKSQLLLDQVLVLGEEGTVQIENGRVVSPEILGGIVEGAIVRGGVIELTNRTDSLRTLDLYAAGTASTTDTRKWATKGETDVADIGTSPNWVASFVFKSGHTNPMIAWDYTLPDNLGVGEITITAEVRSSVAGTVQLNHGGVMNQLVVVANVWSTITLNVDPGDVQDIVSIGYYGTLATARTLEIRSLRFQASSTDVGKIVLDRDTNGDARLMVTDQVGDPAVQITRDGITVDGHLVASRHLRGNPSKMDWLSRVGLTYNGMRFWDELNGVEYIYVGQWQTVKRDISGSVTITPSAADTPTTSSVTFPAGLFMFPPNVVATPSSPRATVGISNITTSGCDITIIRNSTTATVVKWLATRN